MGRRGRKWQKNKQFVSPTPLKLDVLAIIRNITGCVQDDVYALQDDGMILSIPTCPLLMSIREMCTIGAGGGVGVGVGCVPLGGGGG